MSKPKGPRVSKNTQRLGSGWHFHFLRPPTHVRSAEDAAAYLNEDVYDLSFLAEGLARGGAASALLALLFEDLHGAHCCISEILSGMRAPGMETPAIESDAFLLLLREAARVEVPHDPEAHALCLVRILGRVASTRAPALREVA